MVEVLSELDLLCYRYWKGSIITGNSKITMKFFILHDLFELNKEKQEEDL